MTGTGHEDGYWRERYLELEETFAQVFEGFAATLERRPQTPVSAPQKPSAPLLPEVEDGDDHLIPSGEAAGLRVSVIVPCYLSTAFLQGCIDTLTAQTLPHDSFEAIFVFNGPEDGGYDLAKDLLARTDLHHQLARSKRGISPARNTGASIARAPWVTLLDVDDTITPDYLRAMANAATSESVVPVAGIVDVSMAGEETDSPINADITKARGVIDPLDLIRPLAISTLKLIPTEVMRRHPFDPTMRSGEDVALWTDLFEKEGLSLDTTPAFEGAQYRRLVRPDSNGRQGMTHDFMVTQRLDVIAELTRQQTPDGRLAPIRQTFINAQTDFVGRYIRTHPEQAEAVLAEVAERAIPDFPWARLPSDQLLVAYNFAPFNDASAITALKRIVGWGGRWNVISKDMRAVRGRDQSLGRITKDVVAKQRILPGPNAWSSWTAMEEWCERGWSALTEIEGGGVPQKTLYSRAMWPASHFLAALIKARRGDAIRWSAEFSDPLRVDASGVPRVGRVEPSPLLDELREALADAGHRAPRGDSLFAWAETIAYALADEVLFTNPHQFQLMLSEVDDPDLRDRLRSRATISPHPTLPPKYYADGREPSALAPNQCHIAYFGTFYPTRGLGDIFEGLAHLTPAQAARVRFHLFTPPSDALSEALADNPYRSSVSLYKPVSYLDFLSLSTHYDVLLVGDASTRGLGKRMNPYLPSKLSDYRGAGRPIWAHVEPGSILSREPAAHRSLLGNVTSVADVLNRLSSQVES